MKTMKESYLAYKEAEERVNQLLKEYEEEGLTVYAEDSTFDCGSMPCPRGLDNWSGETAGWRIYDEDANEELAAIAYWE